MVSLPDRRADERSWNRSTRENRPRVPVTYRIVSRPRGEAQRRGRGRSPLYCLGAQAPGPVAAAGDRRALPAGRGGHLPPAEHRHALGAGPLPRPERGHARRHGPTAPLQASLVPPPRPARGGGVRRAARVRAHGQGLRAQGRLLRRRGAADAVLAARGLRADRRPPQPRQQRLRRGARRGRLPREGRRVPLRQAALRAAGERRLRARGRRLLRLEDAGAAGGPHARPPLRRARRAAGRHRADGARRRVGLGRARLAAVRGRADRRGGPAGGRGDGDGPLRAGGDAGADAHPTRRAAARPARRAPARRGRGGRRHPRAALRPAPPPGRRVQLADLRRVRGGDRPARAGPRGGLRVDDRADGAVLGDLGALGRPLRLRGAGPRRGGLAHTRRRGGRRGGGPGGAAPATNRFARYLLREVLPLFVAALVALLLLLMLAALLGVLADALARGVPPGLVARYMLLKLPSAVGPGLPLALLFAALVALTRLGQDGEVKAALLLGVGPRRFAVPVLALGLAVSVVAFLNNELVVPRSERLAGEVERDILLLSPETVLSAGTFFTDALGRSIFIGAIEPGGRFEDVTVITPGTSRGPRELIRADVGQARPEEGVWLLEGIRFRALRESSVTLDIAASEAVLPVRGLTARSSAVSDLVYLPIGELVGRVRSAGGAETAAERTALHRKFAEPL